jgi:hypothetical protein
MMNRSDEQLMDSIRMEFILLFEGNPCSLDFAFSLLTLNVLNKILNFVLEGCLIFS